MRGKRKAVDTSRSSVSQFVTVFCLCFVECIFLVSCHPTRNTCFFQSRAPWVPPTGSVPLKMEASFPSQEVPSLFWILMLPKWCISPFFSIFFCSPWRYHTKQQNRFEWEETLQVQGKLVTVSFVIGKSLLVCPGNHPVSSFIFPRCHRVVMYFVTLPASMPFIQRDRRDSWCRACHANTARDDGHQHITHFTLLMTVQLDCRWRPSENPTENIWSGRQWMELQRVSW